MDLTKQQFPNFVVLEEIDPVYYGKKKKQPYRQWRCRCKCGKEFTALSNQIRAKRKISCGCMNKYGNRFSKQDPKIASWNGLVNRYKQSARRRKIKWALTNQDAINLFKANCFFCGSKPKQKYNANISKKGTCLKGSKKEVKKPG